MTEYLVRPWLARLKALKFENPERGTDKTDKSPPSDPSVSFVSAGLVRAENLAASPTDWRRAYDERVRRRSMTPHYTVAEAARLAWGETLNKWHFAHYVPSLDRICTGCHLPTGGTPTLDLPGGAKVHFSNLDCLTAYGTRWRAVATAALAALGLTPPESWEP